jgi:DNA helicase II / ATP-dependent DNA helicase PcrA
VFNPRPGQKEVLEYVGGKMGLSAVPGSGKTHTLSILAAKLVSETTLSEDQEILVVTLVNSAVDNFAARVAGFLRENGLMPGIGYRVRTLHSLAYDIVREHPDLAGVDNRFSIADERTSTEILRLCVSGWIKTHPEFLLEYSDPAYPPDKNIYHWNENLLSFSTAFINQAKDYQITPDFLHNFLSNSKSNSPLLELGYSIFVDYQNSLANRGAVDFEDLIRLAYKILVNNPDVVEKLRYRWPFILEDEAQDSSLIQEKLLRLLCGENGNWVRVGDPNQAIFETFTTADPKLLREFLNETHVIQIDLNHSGRSTKSIIDLANYLIEWTNKSHPLMELRDSLSPPFIQPTPSGDAQQNPADQPDEIHFSAQPLKAKNEIRLIAKSVKKWVAEHPDATVAVLVPRNARGVELAEELNNLGVPIKEMLNSSQSTRDAAKIIHDILLYYVHPTSHRHLVEAIFSILRANKALPDSAKQMTQQILKQLQNQPAEVILENSEEILGDLNIEGIEKNQIHSVIEAILQIARWQNSVLLPIDQMIMTIAMDLFSEPADLALAHKLGVILKSTRDLFPHWELPDFCEELNGIVKNRFRLYGFAEDDLGFNPDNYKGQVVISTIHKAKGLEWDRVYLMSVNNYDFPSLQDYDIYMSEKWFVRQNLNLEAEALSLLKAASSNDLIALNQKEGIATHEARQCYCAERLRLLYVGITRARKQLVFTWNTGRQDNCREAIPLEALRVWWEERNASG